MATLVKIHAGGERWIPSVALNWLLGGGGEEGGSIRTRDGKID